MKRSAWIFPGQGAQRPNMGRDFYDTYAEVRQLFDEAEERLQMHLTRLIFSSDMEQLTQTKNCQPALFLTSCAIMCVVNKEFPDLVPSMCGGLSLGEYSALYAAKRASFAEVLGLVKVRGAAMQKAAEKYPGTMAAVMGLEPSIIEKAGYHIANINTPGQIIIAGSHETIDRAEKELKELGAKRVKQLPVAGAFHSPLMHEAKEELRPLIEAADIQTSSIKLVMNVVGDFVDEVDRVKYLLIEQVSSATHWADCIAAIESKGIDFYLELGPSQLAPMNRKMGTKASTITIEEVRDLEKIYATIEG